MKQNLSLKNYAMNLREPKLLLTFRRKHLADYSSSLFSTKLLGGHTMVHTNSQSQLAQERAALAADQQVERKCQALAHTQMTINVVTGLFGNVTAGQHGGFQIAQHSPVSW